MSSQQPEDSIGKKAAGCLGAIVLAILAGAWSVTKMAFEGALDGCWGIFSILLLVATVGVVHVARKARTTPSDQRR